MEKVISALQKLVDDLADKRFADIVAREENGQLSASEIEQALNDYPGELDIQKIDSSRVNFIEYAKNPNAGILEYELIIDGAISDLTLTCEYNTSENPAISIESIHVL